jgi:hypothetical protein
MIHQRWKNLSKRVGNNKSYVENAIVDSGLDYTAMNLKDRKANRYISNNLLGISLRSHKEDKRHNLTTDGMEQIQNMHRMVNKEGIKYLGIKNDQLAQVLDMLGIPSGLPPVRFSTEQSGFGVCCPGGR